MESGPIEHESVESESEPPSDWKAVVFSGKSKSTAQEEINESEKSDETEKSEETEKSDAESDKSMEYDANSINKDIRFRTESIDEKPISTDDLQNTIK